MSVAVCGGDTVALNLMMVMGASWRRRGGMCMYHIMWRAAKGYSWSRGSRQNGGSQKLHFPPKTEDLTSTWWRLPTYRTKSWSWYQLSSPYSCHERHQEHVDLSIIIVHQQLSSMQCRGRVSAVERWSKVWECYETLHKILSKPWRDGEAYTISPQDHDQYRRCRVLPVNVFILEVESIYW